MIPTAQKLRGLFYKRGGITAMRKRNFAEDFRKVKALISSGKIGELITRVSAIIPGYKYMDGYLKDWYLRSKYRKFIAEHTITYNYRLGGGHTNRIWWMWLQGVDEAPDLCKACLASLRRWHPDKEIITLDKDNISQYVTLPGYIQQKYERGFIPNAHYSDIARLQLLIQHGGIWLDATMLCTGRKFEHFLELPFFFTRWQENDHSSFLTSFIVSDPENPILTLTRDLLLEYWKSYNYTIHYFIFNIFLGMATERFQQECKQIPFFSADIVHDISRAVWNNEDYSEEKLKEFAEKSDFHKLTYKAVSPQTMQPSKFLPNLINMYR